MTTPNQLLEHIAWMERKPDILRANFYVDKAWENIKNMLGKAVHFDFKDVYPVTVHYAFGRQLLDQGRFRLPFPVCLFSLSNPQTNEHLVLLVKQRQGQDFCGVVFGPCNIHIGSEIVDVIRVPFLGFETIGGDLTWGLIIKQLESKQEEEVLDIGGNCAAIAMAASCLLMSKEVEQKVIPVPVRLNARRAKKGKPPINERRIVCIRQEYRQLYRQAADEERRTHKSPCIHWRRGHFRHVRADLIVPVVPCIVGANEESKHIPPPKKYEVIK